MFVNFYSMPPNTIFKLGTVGKLMIKADEYNGIKYIEQDTYFFVTFLASI